MVDVALSYGGCRALRERRRNRIPLYPGCGCEQAAKALKEILPVACDVGRDAAIRITCGLCDRHENGGRPLRPPSLIPVARNALTGTTTARLASERRT